MDINFIIEFTPKEIEDKNNVCITLKKPIPENIKKIIDWFDTYIKIDITDDDTELVITSENTIFISSLYLTLVEDIIEFFRSLEITQELALFSKMEQSLREGKEFMDTHGADHFFDENNKPISRPPDITDKVIKTTRKLQKPSYFSPKDVKEIKDELKENIIKEIKEEEEKNRKKE